MRRFFSNKPLSFHIESIQTIFPMVRINFQTPLFDSNMELTTKQSREPMRKLMDLPGVYKATIYPDQINLETNQTIDNLALQSITEQIIKEKDKIVIDKSNQIIDRYIREALVRDGGNIQIHNYRDNILYVTLSGACSDCPSSTITLKRHVEYILKKYVPIQGVREYT